MSRSVVPHLNLTHGNTSLRQCRPGIIGKKAREGGNGVNTGINLDLLVLNVLLR